MKADLNRLVSDFQASREHRNWHELFVTCVHESPRVGLALEFGVGTGASTRLIAPLLNGPLYGFDSFRGLPEHWNASNPMGTFDRGGAAPTGLPDNVVLVQGWFDESLPRFLSERPGPVRFVHIDCDLYSSTSTVLRHLDERFIDGTVLNFNEFWGYAEAHEHEAKAFAEFLYYTGWKYEALGRSGRDYCQAAFKLRN